MRSPATLLRQYETGAIAASEFIAEALAGMTEANAHGVLNAFPAELVDQLTLFLRLDRSHRVIAFGGASLPSERQLDIARAWLGRRSKTGAEAAK